MTDEFPTSSPDFAERLVSADPLPADRKSQLQQELNGMFEKQLTLPRRIAFAVVCVFALVSSALCGYLAVTEPDLPTSGRVALSVGTLFGLAWAAVGIRILKRGAIDLKRDHRKTANMAWSFTVLMVVFFLITGMSIEDRLLGLMMIAQSLAFLIGAAVILVTQRIEQSELATRERLLQIELLVTDLLERQNDS
jgi:hypothetical protein